MLKHLLNDRAILKSVQDVDEYDVPTISDIRSISCKFEFAIKNDSNYLSSQKTLPARMFCVEDVQVGDIISFDENNYKVIQVNNYNDFEGKLMLREVFLL